MCAKEVSQVAAVRTIVVDILYCMTAPDEASEARAARYTHAARGQVAPATFASSALAGTFEPDSNVKTLVR